MKLCIVILEPIPLDIEYHMDLYRTSSQKVRVGAASGLAREFSNHTKKTKKGIVRYPETDT